MSHILFNPEQFVQFHPIKSICVVGLKPIHRMNQIQPQFSLIDPKPHQFSLTPPEWRSNYIQRMNQIRCKIYPVLDPRNNSKRTRPVSSLQDLEDAFLIAVKSGSGRMVATLLDTGKIPEYLKSIALITAAEQKNEESVKAILKSGLDLLFHAKGVALGETAGINPLIEEMLHQSMSSPSERMICRGLAITRAAELGNFQAVLKFLQQGPVSLDELDNALVKAAEKGHAAIIEALLQHKELPSEHAQSAALFAAIKSQDEKSVAALLKNSGPNLFHMKGVALGEIAMAPRIAALLHQSMTSDSEQIFCRGFAIIRAAELGNLQTVVKLLRQGPIASEDLGSALLKSALTGHIAIASALLQYKEPVQKEAINTPPFHRGQISIKMKSDALLIAMKQGNLQLAATLLAEGNMSECVKSVSLQTAVAIQNQSIVSLFLRDGKISDLNRRIALRKAKKLKNQKIIALLQRTIRPSIIAWFKELKHHYVSNKL